jgi:hypothetical protein
MWQRDRYRELTYKKPTAMTSLVGHNSRQAGIAVLHT